MNTMFNTNNIKIRKFFNVVYVKDMYTKNSWLEYGKDSMQDAIYRIIARELSVSMQNIAYCNNFSYNYCVTEEEARTITALENLAERIRSEKIGLEDSIKLLREAGMTLNIV